MALDLYIQIYCLVWFFPPHLPPESRGSTRSYYIGCATSVVCYCFNKEMKWLLPKISVCSLFPLSHLFFDQVARSLLLLLFYLVILYEMILCVLRPSSCSFQKGEGNQCPWRILLYLVLLLGHLLPSKCFEAFVVACFCSASISNKKQLWRI